MRNTLRRAIKSAAVGGMVLALGGATASPPAAADAVRVGRPAPDAEIVLVDGTKLRLSDLKGQVVVLNFWATWCAPCKVELPILDRYYQVQKRHGLRVFAVTTEGSLPLFKLRGLFAAMQISAARKIGNPYTTIRAVPTNYIIDRAGIVRYAKAAALDLDDLNREIVPLLQEPVPAT